jgi:DNA helicase-2/ATP-dependent DNA helicase PcrA
MELTEEQKKVLSHTLPGHARVLAGPGTGKSTTAIALLKKIVEESEGKVRVKFLTFSRATTLELAAKLSPELFALVKPSTVHSFSISTLLKNPGAANLPLPLRIPDEFERKQIIVPQLADIMGVNPTKISELITEMSAKWESLDPEELPNVTPEERARFSGIFSTHRNTYGYTLLDELPDLLRRAMLVHQDLEGFDFDLLVVDEYQDLNACELELLKLISQRGVSIIGIGDDDQSIYSKRKAHPAGIRNFLEDFNTESDYKLTIAQRSPKKILRWAEYVIMGDPFRTPRPALTFKESAIDGTAELLQFKSEQSEAKGIARLIQTLVVKGVPVEEILVLSMSDRYGNFTNPIREELVKLNIKANTIQDYFEDLNVRKLLSIFHLSENTTDSLGWATAIKLYPGLGSAVHNTIFSLAEAQGVRFGEVLKKEAAAGFPSFTTVQRRKMIELNLEVEKILSKISIPEEKKMDWGNWIIEQSEIENLPVLPESFKDILRALDQSFRKADDSRNFNTYFPQLQPSIKDLTKSKSDGVRFMTLGGSKGLTVQATIVVGVDHDLLLRPDVSSAEARRLLYVGMTRPKEYLFLTWVSRRRGPQARVGNTNIGRRNFSDFLQSGPVDSRDGVDYLKETVTKS